MKAKWLILQRDNETSRTVLGYLAQERGCDFHLLSPDDFANQVERGQDASPQCVVPIAGCFITATAHRRRQWTGVWHDPAMYACSTYYAHWGAFTTQQRYAFLTLGEIRRRKEWLYETFGNPDGAIFLRPDLGEKLFTGQLVPRKHWEVWTASVAEHPADTLCVVGEKRAIWDEYRLLIYKGKVITGSSYFLARSLEKAPLEEMNPATRDRITTFAEMVASRPYPGLPPIYALDIAIEKNTGNPSVLEVGCINSAGWYAMDRRKMFEALSDAAEERWHEETARN